MIAVPPGVRILLAARPVDFRKGMDGLAALVQQALRADPFQGDVFIFRPKRADRVKILVYDGTGLCLYSKRLEAGRFSWPSPAEGVVRLSARAVGDAARGLGVAPAAAPSGAATEHGMVSGSAGFLALSLSRISVMSLVLDDLPRDPDRLLQHLQQMTEVVTQQNASLVSLQAKHDTVLAERDRSTECQSFVPSATLFARSVMRRKPRSRSCGS